MSTRQRKKDLRTDKELWGLVRYLDDSVLHTLLWDKKWGIKVGAVHMVKWKDGKKYEAKLLAIGNSEESDAEVSPGPALTSVQPSTSQISSVKSSAYPENVTPSMSQDSRKPPSKKKGPFKTLSLSSGKEKTSKCRKMNPVAWTEEESKFVLDYFKTKMHLGEIPGKRDVLNCKTTGELLKNREWVAIKSHVWNKLMKMGIKKKA